MRYATDRMMSMDGAKLIELEGFLTDDGEVILSDSDTMSSWKKIKVKVEKDSIGFWLEENERELQEPCEEFEYNVNINS